MRPISYHFHRWKHEFGNFIFSPRCGVCSESLANNAIAICESCLQKVEYIHAPLCTACGKKFAGENCAEHICEQCLRLSPPFSMARSITFYEEPVRTLLHNLKYRYDTAAVAPLGKIARSFDFSPFVDCDFILPVPLHITRLKRRGMNQALLLARLFFADYRTKINTRILVRNRSTIPQTQLDVASRKRNVKAAFAVQHNDIIDNKKICLVDDIFTTGVTVSECAATLRRAGAIEVRVVTMARVRLFN